MSPNPMIEFDTLVISVINTEIVYPTTEILAEPDNLAAHRYTPVAVR